MSVKWPAGTPPVFITTPNAEDLLVFVTKDGGTNWLGFEGGLTFS